MPQPSICELCLKEKRLQKSHYIPAALYPKNAKLEFHGRATVTRIVRHMKSPLLCFDCEQLLTQNGESEVLLRVAPKLAKKGTFPLHEKLRLALPREDHPELKRYAGYEVGLDMDKFAYFMLSLVWRGAVHAWPKPDGGFSTQLPLNEFTEPIRRYLLGEAPFPPNTSVIVIVCTDDLSRKMWIPPTDIWETGCLNFRFHALGVFFRAMMGRNLPLFYRDASCTSPYKWIAMGDCALRTQEVFDVLEAMRAREQRGGSRGL